VICAAILAGIGFVVLVYGLRDRLQGHPQAKSSGPSFQWLNVTNGQTRQQLSQILGAPTAHTISNVDVWQKRGATLRVTYDEIGIATNVWLDGLWIFAFPNGKTQQSTNAAVQKGVR
jgi:hypothetical protein